MSALNDNLNDTIASAVKAQVQAQVLEALSGDDTVRSFVVAALQQPITVRRGYKDYPSTYLSETLKAAFQEMVKGVIGEVLAEEADLIREECRKHLRRRAADFAQSFTDNVIKQASRAYGVSVELRFPGESE